MVGYERIGTDSYDSPSFFIHSKNHGNITCILKAL